MSRNRVFPKTSQYLPQQFPEFYRDEGPNFIAFVQEFYRWKEEISNRNKSRRLLDYGDIDETDEPYLSHFINKYMWSLPRTMIEPRFLEKHILDVYRSKGSVEGLRLLFRMLYNKEATVYVPSKDMLAPSAGVFFRARYIELTPNPDNAKLVQSRIYAWESKATALAESYVEMFVRGRPVYVLFISNVVGNFQIGDHIYSDGMSPTNAPAIVGSMTRFNQNRVIPDASVGDKYNDVAGYGALRVSEISSLAGGTIDFNIIDGGHGYTYNAKIYVVSGAVTTQSGDFLMTEDDDMLDIVATGSSADFSISNIDNLETLGIDVSIIAPYENDLLTDSTILYYNPIVTNDLFALTNETNDVFLTEGLTPGTTINDDVIIWEWESITNITVGTIALVSVESPGLGYIDNATVVVIDPFISLLGIYDIDGNRYGEDAIIEGAVAPSKDAAKSYSVENSGYGYYEGELVSLKYGNDEFLGDDAGGVFITEDGLKLCWGEDDSETVTGFAVLGAIGKQNGYWLDNDGMLNSNKVVQDSYYYQEYSYDINTELPIDTYEKVIKNVYHPAGVELFGTAAAYLDNENRSSGTGGILQYSIGEAGGVGSGSAVGTRVMPGIGASSGTSIPLANGFELGVLSGARVYSAGVRVLEGDAPPPSFVDDPFIVLDFIDGVYELNGLAVTSADLLTNTAMIETGYGARFIPDLIPTDNAVEFTANVVSAINATNGKFSIVAEWTHTGGSGYLSVMSLMTTGGPTYDYTDQAEIGIDLTGVNWYWNADADASTGYIYPDIQPYPEEIRKVAIRYDIDDGMAISLNGNTAVANTPVLTGPPTWGSVVLGGYTDVYAPLAGYVRRIKVYPAKTDVELALMSEQPIVRSEELRNSVVSLDFQANTYYLGYSEVSLDKLLDRTDMTINSNGALFDWNTADVPANFTTLAMTALQTYAADDYGVIGEYDLLEAGTSTIFSAVSDHASPNNFWWDIENTPFAITQTSVYNDISYNLVNYVITDELAPRRFVAQIRPDGSTDQITLFSDSGYWRDTSGYVNSRGETQTMTVGGPIVFDTVSLGGWAADGALNMNGYIRNFTVKKWNSSFDHTVYSVNYTDIEPIPAQTIDVGDSVIYMDFTADQHYINGVAQADMYSIAEAPADPLYHARDSHGLQFIGGDTSMSPLYFNSAARALINGLDGQFVVVCEYVIRDSATIPHIAFSMTDAAGTPSGDAVYQITHTDTVGHVRVNLPYEDTPGVAISHSLDGTTVDPDRPFNVAFRYDNAGNNAVCINNGSPITDVGLGYTQIDPAGTILSASLGANPWDGAIAFTGWIRRFAVYPTKNNTDLQALSVKAHND